MNEIYSTDVRGLQKLTGLGRNKCIELGRKAGASFKVGSRTLYNVQVVTDFLEDLRVKENNKVERSEV